MDFRQLVTSQWDRVAAVVCAVVGALVLLVGWIGISGTAFTAEQIPYIISGGIASIYFLGLSGSLWLSADLRDEWRKLDSIDEALRSLGTANSVTEALGNTTATPSAFEAPVDPAPETPAPRRAAAASRSTATAKTNGRDRATTRVAPSRRTRPLVVQRVKAGDVSS